ncbi:MAG TPA: hypothetical protein VGV37_06865 [Aliidongia sp.]|uniref:hypothetical protein n=1 Tax=Aliidongia sp. TaxID=1914230 RepID=UPI002DDCADA5|nr:hypothetical protein [Aliidongia sp.]HEV2674247.1 hypothetical protein [Aliidongia sp.]
MPKYQPISVPVPLKASVSDLVDFRWGTAGISADFIIPGNNTHLLRVAFDRQCIVRLLDEMPLSTENDDGPTAGLVSENFAYIVEGSVFSRIQSDAWKIALPSATHYRFVTGWACMDVLSSSVPSFVLVARSSVDEVQAAARVLDRDGRFHGWWPKTTAAYDDLDPIGKDEFESVVERMLMAAARTRNG